jgi:hypothetical protein
MGGLGVLTLGEVHTGVIQHSAAVSGELADELLALVGGIAVRRGERPIAYAVSPDVLTGVDCSLPGRGARTRVVGTVVSRAMITAGQVLQGSAFTQVEPAAVNRRQPWSHYLARPGVVEALGRLMPEQITNTARRERDLDLGAVAVQTMETVQGNARLDHGSRFKAPRTVLWWAARTDPGDPRMTFTVNGDLTRAVDLRADGLCAPDVARFCEDLALHDWLLTTVVRLVDLARVGAVAQERVVARLRPAIDHLLHVWMPAARVDPALAELWTFLDRYPGLTRQWQTTVDRIRDQLALATINIPDGPSADDWGDDGTRSHERARRPRQRALAVSRKNRR